MKYIKANIMAAPVKALKELIPRTAFQLPGLQKDVFRSSSFGYHAYSPEGNGCRPAGGKVGGWRRKVGDEHRSASTGWLLVLLS